MIYEPRPYQRLITEHQLALPRNGTWAGMGMGKTPATLESIAVRQLINARPELVIAPYRVAQSTWPDEARKWSNLSHLEVQPILGSPAEREKALKNTNAAVFTINYENLPWLVDSLGDRWIFENVNADECTRLKSFRKGGKTGRRARSLAKVAHTKVKGWSNLTGTPAPNGIIDMWGQNWFLDAGRRLGLTFSAYEQRWFCYRRRGNLTDPNSRPKLEILPFAQEQIEDALRDLHITIDPSDWFDIKKPIVNVIKVALPVKARALYRDMEKKLFMELAGHQIEAFSAASKSIKCLQLANGAAYVGEGSDEWVEVHDAKLQALESVVEEAMGAPVLVAYHFKSDLARLLKAFPYGRVLDKDPQTIRDWNAGRIRLLFAHPASAGHGLNLQDGGNIIAFFGLWWALEEHDQIRERIGPVRQFQAGHERPVFEHYIIAADTVDELVMDRLKNKRSVQDVLLEAMKRRALA